MQASLRELKTPQSIRLAQTENPKPCLDLPNDDDVDDDDDDDDGF